MIFNVARTNILEEPLLSILCWCKDSKNTIGRCIDSLLDQDYANVEIVVQDGASTDGTLEILLGYGEKIKLMSEPDKDPNEAWMKALARARGDILCHCLADEELLPGAATRAIAYLCDHPDVPAIYGDVYLTDREGIILERVNAYEWDYEKVISFEKLPFFSSSFFRKSCWDTLNFSVYSGSGDYELWLKMGLRYKPVHVAEAFSKYGVHDTCRSRQAAIIWGIYPRVKEAFLAIMGDPWLPEGLRQRQQEIDSALNLRFAALMASSIDSEGIDKAKAVYYFWQRGLDHCPELMRAINRFATVLTDTLRNKKIYLYGAGQLTPFLIESIDFKALNISILGIVDKDERKLGSHIRGYEVVPVEVLSNNGAEVLISSRVFQEEIAAELKRNYGIEGVRIYARENNSILDITQYFPLVNYLALGQCRSAA